MLNRKVLLLRQNAVLLYLPLEQNGNTTASNLPQQKF